MSINTICTLNVHLKNQTKIIFCLDYINKTILAKYINVNNSYSLITKL